MKTKAMVSAVAAAILMTGVCLQAEPGDFGVNGENAWHQSPVERTKHTDGFGDSYYTFKAESSKACVDKEIRKQKQKVAETPTEITEGLQASADAIRALRKNETKQAEASLKKANRAFTAALKAHPKLKMVPVYGDVVVNTLADGPEAIKTDIEAAGRLLTRHEVQAARELLLPLQDDIEVTIGYLPMDIYPQTTKEALDALNKNDSKGALTQLLVGMGMIVSERTVIPIPLLEAEDLTAQAAKLDKTKKDQALRLLDGARVELKKAVLLGYAKQESGVYDKLSGKVAALQREIRGKNEAQKLYDELKKEFKTLIDKVRGHKA